jgi:hypothetical protein
MNIFSYICSIKNTNTMKTEVDYTKLDADYPQVRQDIINLMVAEYGLTEENASFVVDYENDTCDDYEKDEEPEVRYNQVKDLMEQDLINDRPYAIQEMADEIIENDEGDYQLSLIEK